MQLGYLSADKCAARCVGKCAQGDPNQILSQLLLLHSEPLRPVTLWFQATVCMQALPVGMCVPMTSTPTGRQRLMISTCLGSLGCHNLEFITLYVSDLLLLLHRAGQARFWRGKKVSNPPSPCSTSRAPALSDFASRQLRSSSLSWSIFELLEVEIREVRRGAHGADCLMRSRLALKHRLAD